MTADNTVPLHKRDPRVRITNDAAEFDGFTERDPDVVEILREADDIEHASHTILQIGARAVRVTNASTDANVVERAFTKMTATFDEQLETALEQVAEASDRLFKDGGEVEKLLDQFRKEFDSSLGDTFDPNSKKSVIANIENIVAEMARGQREALRRLVDPSEDGSPLRKIQRDLAEMIKATSADLAKQVQELSERIAVDEKGAQVFDLTTLKGTTFEDVLHAAICNIAAPHGDTAEQTRNETGYAGNKKGDEVVTINPEDVGGATCRIAFEVKDRKLGQAAVTAELDDATANRDAEAAVLVFAKQEQAPTTVPFSYSGKHAIVAFDKDNPDVNVLRLAFMWARWVARRAVTASEVDEIDLDRIAALFDRISTALGRTKTVKRAHTQSTNGLKVAREHLETMEYEIVDALDDLRELLGA